MESDFYNNLEKHSGLFCNKNVDDRSELVLNFSETFLFYFLKQVWIIFTSSTKPSGQRQTVLKKYLAYFFCPRSSLKETFKDVQLFLT